MIQFQGTFRLVKSHGRCTRMMLLTELYNHGFQLFYPMTKTQFMQRRGCAEMCNFCMAALVFLTGYGIKARTHAHAEITHFPTLCIIKTWKALDLHAAACFPGPDDAPLELCDFRTGMGFCYITKPTCHTLTNI